MKYQVGDRIVKTKGTHTGMVGEIAGYFGDPSSGIIIIRYDYGLTDATFESFIELYDPDCLNID